MTTIREYLLSDAWAQHSQCADNQYFKLNSQQLMKSPIFLDCLRAPAGFKFVSIDISSLEPNVIAEFSGDPCYKEIYSSGKPHDPYFYVTCKLLDKDGSIAKVYNIENPTQETVALAKKQFKKERSVGKVFQLMSTYKAGAAAIYRKLRINGVDVTKEEVETNRERYWGPELFGQVLEYEDSLLAEAAQRDGWILNGSGRPLVVTPRNERKILNTFAQSTGHDITDLLIYHTEKLAQDANIDCHPIVPDYHDETIWLVPEGQAMEMANVMTQALNKVNETIKYDAPLQGDPEITDDFTTFKGPDPTPGRWYENKCSNE